MSPVKKTYEELEQDCQINEKAVAALNDQIEALNAEIEELKGKEELQQESERVSKLASRERKIYLQRLVGGEDNAACPFCDTVGEGRHAYDCEVKSLISTKESQVATPKKLEAAANTNRLTEDVYSRELSDIRKSAQATEEQVRSLRAAAEIAIEQVEALVATAKRMHEDVKEGLGAIIERMPVERANSVAPSTDGVMLAKAIEELRAQVKVLGDDVVAAAAAQARAPARVSPAEGKRAVKEKTDALAAEQAKADAERLASAAAALSEKGMRTEVHDPMLERLAAAKEVAVQAPKAEAAAPALAPAAATAPPAQLTGPATLTPATTAAAAPAPPSEITLQKLTDRFVDWAHANGEVEALKLLQLAGAERLSKVSKDKWPTLWELLGSPPAARAAQAKGGVPAGLP